MSKPVISVENLSKAYRIGVKDEIPDTLVGAMTNVLRAPFKKFNRLRKLDTFAGSPDDDHSEDTLWALKDVSFDVQEGEVVGIIGRNGAGKSTLLKVLSRITEPTSGRVVLRGRVSSLLEVGTGFHPELTGRDNVYMNGTILGMTKREIDRKFDEIVDFSGVEKFLDTPVKRYSSGMQVRLAFAVAAHLEPEILIIDEVLAVGDAEFQRKCLGKMKDVAGQGRTVLFVSHNMAAVQLLCGRAVRLSSGNLVSNGVTADVLREYEERISEQSSHGTGSITERHGSGLARLEHVEIVAVDGSTILSSGMSVCCRLKVDRVLDGMECIFTVYDTNGHALCSFDRRSAKSDYDTLGESDFSFECHFPLLFKPGSYRINAAIEVRNEIVDLVEGVCRFEVMEGVVHGRSVRGNSRFGSIEIPHHWLLPGSTV